MTSLKPVIATCPLLLLLAFSAPAQVSRSLDAERPERTRPEIMRYEANRPERLKPAAPATALGYKPICDLPCIEGKARSSHAWSYLDGVVYVAGGHKGMEHSYLQPQFSADVHALDLTTKAWRRLESRPHPAQGYTLAAYRHPSDGRPMLAALGGFAYADNLKPSYRSLALVETYDSRLDDWTTSRTLMPYRRSSHGMGVFGTCAVLVGGWNASPRWEDDRGGHFHAPFTIVDLLSGASGSGYVIEPLEMELFTRRAFGYAQAGDKLYIAGGLGTGGELDLKSTVAEIAVGKVTCTGRPTIEYTVRALPSLPHGLFAPGLGISPNGALYAFGGGYFTEAGNINSFSYTDEVYRLDPGSTAWTPHRKMKEAKSFVGAVAVSATEFLLVGGHRSSSDGNGPTPSMEQYTIP